MEKNNQQGMNVPMAILTGAILIAIATAGAIVWTHRTVSTPDTKAAAAAVTSAPQISMKPVTNADHILGNPNAPVKIVEYSDPSCPYCKVFNTTMWQIMNEYGKSGQVAWIYRSFPLDKPNPDGQVLHPNAGHEAQALECVASLGGNDKFWIFEQKLYSTTPSVTSATPQGLDQNQLPVLALASGVNIKDFNQCLESGKFKSVVEAQYLDGLNAGVAGTPFSVIITSGGTEIPVPGAQPYANLKNALTILVGTSTPR